MTLVVASGGVGAAVAITSYNDPDDWPVVVATPAPKNATPPKRAQLPESEALRHAVVERVGLFRRPATEGDTVPTDLIPKAPIIPRLTEKDLAFARKLPNADAMWVLPLPTGQVVLMGRHGGAVFAAEQLATGGVVSSNPNEAGENVVTGIVPDGTKNVSVDTGTGKTQGVEVRDGAYSTTFPPTEHPRSLEITTATGERLTTPLAG